MINSVQHSFMWLFWCSTILYSRGDFSFISTAFSICCVNTLAVLAGVLCGIFKAWKLFVVQLEPFVPFPDYCWMKTISVQFYEIFTLLLSLTDYMSRLFPYSSKLLKPPFKALLTKLHCHPVTIRFPDSLTSWRYKVFTRHPCAAWSGPQDATSPLPQHGIMC